MLRSRFFLKVYAVYAALILLAIAVVGGLVAQKVEQESQQSIQRSLADQAVLVRELAASALRQSVTPSLDDRLQALGGSISARLTVIRADGVVLADSQEVPPRWTTTQRVQKCWLRVRRATGRPPGSATLLGLG